jgi:hypothetical protein
VGAPGWVRKGWDGVGWGGKGRRPGQHMTVFVLAKVVQTGRLPSQGADVASLLMPAGTPQLLLLFHLHSLSHAVTCSQVKLYAYVYAAAPPHLLHDSALLDKPDATQAQQLKLSVFSVCSCCLATGPPASSSGGVSGVRSCSCCGAHAAARSGVGGVAWAAACCPRTTMDGVLVMTLPTSRSTSSGSPGKVPTGMHAATVRSDNRAPMGDAWCVTVAACFVSGL